jgi:phosphatidylinositol-3-phosphatase
VRRLVIPLAVLLLAACGSGNDSRPHAEPSVAATTPSPTATFTGGGGATVTTTSTNPSKVLVVVLENHSQTQVLQQMSYLKGLSAKYGRTTAYRAVTHPSLPNYLVMAGGSTFGVRNDKNPSGHPLRGPSVFGQAFYNHRTAKTYAESMPSRCKLVNYGRYAVRHNPWTYFADSAERAACGRSDVPSGTASSGALRSDALAGTLPNVGFVVPNVCSDAHDCSLGTADRWLRAWVPVWTGGPDYRAGRLAIVITFDEDDLSQGNTVLTVVVHPRLSGRVVTAGVTHYNLSAWLSRVAGGYPLRSAAGKTSLGRYFGLASA